MRGLIGGDGMARNTLILTHDGGKLYADGVRREKDTLLRGYFGQISARFSFVYSEHSISRMAYVTYEIPSVFVEK